MNVPFLEAVMGGGLVGDGAMGSLLYERGVFVNRNFDEVNISQPELVYRIHREYLMAGAQVIESNTYGANRIRLERHGLADQVETINAAAVRILLRAVGEAAYAAGSMGPTGLSQGELRHREIDVRAAYAEQARLLARAGCQVLSIETFHDPAELRLAIEAARSSVALPIMAFIALGRGGAIADGTQAQQLAHEMVAWGANVVGANCSGPGAIFEIVQQMVQTGLPIAAVPNAGTPESIEDRLIYLATPENFGVFARRMFKAGVKFVGGCCGTSPGHINRVSAASRMVAPRLQEVAAPPVQPVPYRQVTPLAQRSAFAEKLGKHFVVSVEVNPHPGLDTAPPIAAAQMLLKAGADGINIADGPRATVAMSNLALAVRMREQTGTDPLLHVCCRDRNLLGLQSFVLGAHVLGLRNLVVITGDPPKIGDYPDATAVYDLDSIGLLKLLHGYNQGVDPAGKSMPPTQFVLATGVEPAATDFHREMLRLQQKVDAGADLIMTQPVYDGDQLERFLTATQHIHVPVLVGILPLASFRNAEFIHHNIPGMRIPEHIRDRLRQAKPGDEARREGTRIAAEILAAVRQRVAGAYIMPPLGRYEMGAAILQSLGTNRSLGPHVPGCV